MPMSLKGNIGKLVQAKPKRLKDGGEARAEYFAQQRQNFSKMRRVLDEIVASVSAEYLKATLNDDRALIEIGSKKSNGCLEVDTRWWIGPDSNFRAGGIRKLFSSKGKPGFKVEEKKYFSHPKYDIPEDTLIFKSEYDVAKYLLPKIAEKVALYRHLKDS